MRLIDVDALLYSLGASDRDMYVAECINEAPTVDAVALPCKVGDTVYAVRRCSCHRHDDTPWKSCVGKVALKSNKGIARACLYVSPTPFKVEHLSQIGKTAFLTREEAEAELARRTANE